MTTRLVTNSSNKIVEVRVPASTSNLGSGFDCCGLALNLYLTVRAFVDTDLREPCFIETVGQSETGASRDQQNLIYRAMRHVAERERLTLPPVYLSVHNDIPFASGLGSSGAAIVAGITLCSLLCGHELSTAKTLRYATELEGHADNVAAALLGGFVINCIKDDGEVLAVKSPWPEDLKVVAISPPLFIGDKICPQYLAANYQPPVLDVQPAARGSLWRRARDAKIRST
jgi:homoserine kinase